MQTTTRNGVSAKEIERTLDVCYKTALRMAHQIKKLMANKNTEPLSGVIEMDDSWVGGLLKNKHKSVRAGNKQGKGKTEGKEAVFAMIERGGKVIANHVAASNHETILPLVEQNVELNSTIVTDTANLFKVLNKAYSHHTVNHSQDEYVRGEFHTNTIEGFFSQLKRTIKGTHIHVSPKHLQKYVDEVAFRYMNKSNQAGMFDAILERVAS